MRPQRYTPLHPTGQLSVSEAEAVSMKFTVNKYNEPSWTDRGRETAKPAACLKTHVTLT